MKKILLTVALIVAASTAFAEVKKPTGVAHDLKILRVHFRRNYHFVYGA